MHTMGLYIHVPLCLKKCPYCDFYSLPYSDLLADGYTDAVCRAISSYKGADALADTLYLGGGTPSLLGGERLSRICKAAMSRFGLQDAEITLEANPGSIDYSTLSKAREAGFNRISLGLQSASDMQLKALGRTHTSKQAAQAVAMARKAGFNNISLDLMIGTPGQTMEILEESISFCASLGVEHVSAYLLKIEEGTPFHKMGVMPQGEELESRLYLAAVSSLEEKGYIQYEISNFSLAGFESRHNLKYWLCEEYLGIGPAAHFFVEGRRFYFERDISAFMNAHDIWALPIPDGEGGGFEEYAMLRLRLTQGLDLAKAAFLYPDEDYDAIFKRSRELASHGLCRVSENIASLTPQGFLLSNPVICRILGL